MTEIGRRTAIFIGTIAFTTTILMGLVFYNGNVVIVSFNALIAGLLFGLGGMLIGNLTEGYIVHEARREQARISLERKTAKEAMKQAEETDVVMETEM